MYYVSYGRGGKSRISPMRHPETHELTLFRVRENEAGEWRLETRHTVGFEEVLDTPSVVDLESGELTGLSSSMRKID